MNMRGGLVLVVLLGGLMGCRTPSVNGVEFKSSNKFNSDMLRRYTEARAVALATERQLTAASIENPQEIIRLLASGGLSDVDRLKVRKLIDALTKAAVAGGDDNKQLGIAMNTVKAAAQRPDFLGNLEKLANRGQLSKNEILETAEFLSGLRTALRAQSAAESLDENQKMVVASYEQAVDQVIATLGKSVAAGESYTLAQAMNESQPADEKGKTQDGKNSQQAGAKSDVQNKANEQKSRLDEFKGLGFSIGPAVKFGGRKEIRSADAEGGTVRVRSERRTRPLAMLSLNYLFTPHRELLGVEPGRWGFGPWVGLTFGSDNNVIDSVGAGAMLSFRYDSERSGRDARAFGIGLGVLYDDSVEVLADGVTPGAAAPAGVTNLTKTRSDISAVLVFNFQFDF